MVLLCYEYPCNKVFYADVAPRIEGLKLLFISIKNYYIYSLLTCLDLKKGTITIENIS